MDIIQTKHLTKSFDNVKAVDNLDLNIEEGEIFGLVGPDGAGKTTTIRLLTTIMNPTSGKGLVIGKDIVKDAEEIKESIGYMSQRFGLYPDLTVMENLLFYADIYGVPTKERPEKIEKLLAFSNLTPFQKRLANNLSGGMKQKLGLACALIHTPKILFLDEPTGGVDPVSRRDFWRILYQLHREKVTILLTTSYLDEAERCNRVGFMNDGKLIAVGTPKELKELINGFILEVDVDNPRKSMELLREFVDPNYLRLFGNSIHVFTKDPQSTTKVIEDALRQSPYKLQALQQIEPSLEDVFIALLTKSQKEGNDGPRN